MNRKGFKIIRNEKGIALLVALMVLIMLTLIGMAAILTTTTEVNIAGNEKQATQALYLAEAGISRVKAFFEDPASFNPPADSVECLAPGGGYNWNNCTDATYHTNDNDAEIWPESFFDRRRRSGGTPSYINAFGASQFLNIDFTTANGNAVLDANNAYDNGSPKPPDQNQAVGTDLPAMRIIDDAYINDTLLDGPDPDTIGDFRDIGTIQSIEIYPPLYDTNFAVIRVTAEVGGATRIVEQEIGPSNNFAVANGVSAQGATGWNGNGSVHWGAIVTDGNVNTGQNSIHCKTAAVCGGPDDISSGSGEADKWWSLDAIGTITIGNTTLPDPAYDTVDTDGDPADWNMTPNSTKMPQTLSGIQKDALKEYAQGNGQYYVYCSIDDLLHTADESGNPTGAGISFKELTNGKSYDMLYVDVGAINTPSCNPGLTPPPTPTFSISGGGGYYTNSNIILNGTFSISGSGGTTDITAQNPDQVDAEQPGTKTLGVHINGLLYTTGNFDSTGNPVIYGAVISEGGFAGSGTPDIWYNRNLINGLPGLTWTSKQTWREIKE